MNLPERFRKHLFVYLLALAALAVSATAAYATHFRYGTITWSIPNAAQPNIVKIRFESAWRWSFPWPANPSLGTTVTQPAGTLQILNASTNALVTSTNVLPKVTAINTTEDWFAGEFEWIVTLPAATTNYRVVFNGCCRISTLKDGNNDVSYVVESGLTVRMPPSPINRPPTSSTLPIITLAQNQPSSFAIPAFDPDGDPVTFSISSTALSGLAVAKPAGLNMTPQGLVTWTPTTVGLYALQVMVSDPNGAYTPVDLVLRVVAATGLPPVLRINGSTAPASFSVVAGQPVTFSLTAADPENKSIQLTSSSLPSGANMSPSLPVQAVNPSSSFFWTPSLAQIGSYVLSFAGLDADGRQASISAQISVTNQPPTIACTTAGTTIEAVGPGGAGWGMSADVNDPDGGTVTVTFIVDSVQRLQLTGVAVPGTRSYSSGALQFGLGTHTYQARVSDGVSAAVSCTGTFTIVDTTAPTVPVPADLVEPATSPNGAFVMYQAPIASDLVDPAPAVVCTPPSGSLFPIGVSQVTCTATDASGNANSSSFTVRVTDPTPPVITPVVTGTPGNAPWYVSPAAVSWTVVDPESGVASRTGCDPVVVNDTNGTTLTCSATNNDNVSASASVSVAVDTIAPANGGFAIVSPTNPNGTVEATSPSGAVVMYTSSASDAGSGVANTTCMPASGSVFAVGLSTITCSTTDNAGNVGTSNFPVTVADTTPPNIPPAPGQDFQVAQFTEATSPAGAVVFYQTPAWQDAVDPSAVTVCVPASGSLFPIGQAPITCTSTDAFGNSSMHQYVGSIVRDTTPPAITLNGGNPFRVEGATPYAEPGATALDIVDLDVTTSIVIDSSAVNTAVLGTYTVTYTVADSRGNSSSVTRTVSVEDATPPQMPTLTGVSAEATSPLGAVVTYSVPAATDTVAGSLPLTCAPVAGSMFALGATTVTCTAIDPSGNTAQATFGVTVSDTTAPNVPPAPGQDFQVAPFTEATSAAGAVVTYQQPIWRDSVDPAPVTVCLPASGSVFPIGQATITCTSTDSVGNSAVHTYAGSNVRDTTAPALTVPGNIEVLGDNPSGSAVTFTATAVDVVTTNPTVACTPAPGSTFAYGTTTVTCTATDGAGNTSSGTFTVTVKDNTPPVVTPTVTGTLGGNGWYTSDVNVSWTVTDAQSNVTSTGCGPTVVNADGTASFTCSATSEGGTTSVTQEVKRDGTAPVVTTPAPVTVNAVNASGAPVSYAPASAVDPASGVNGTPVCVPASGSTFGLGTSTVTCTVGDNAGNVGTASFTVTVRDTTAPVITATSPSTGSLWPPNHQMVPLTIAVSSTDNVTTQPVCTVTGVTSNEPQNGLGDGDTPNDWTFGGLSVRLRAERAGNGNGRTYTIAVQCADAAGNTSTSSTTVSVPKSMKK